MKRIIFLLLFFVFSVNTFSQVSIYEPTDLEDVEASLKDLGKLWTFDNIPFEYWKEAYNFEPDNEWLNKAQKAALQFSSYCSAAFVSQDGLIMTNHHCGRGVMLRVQKENEDLLKNGFFAKTLQKERKVPNLYVDQLVVIEDVTDEIYSAIEKGETDDEKIQNRINKIDELEQKYREETGLMCNVVTLYNGGKFALYGYKRYTDIRLVMAPEFQIASTGWDWDNFTYPRYELDFMFFRAYENNEPVKVDHYFKWNPDGAEVGEPIFVIGRPGNTDRLLSTRQLEHFRDVMYPSTLTFFNGIYDSYFKMFEKYPERQSELLNVVMSVGNARKVYAGRLLSLNDEYLMKRKKVFEEELISKINNDDELKESYGHIWEALDRAFDELTPVIKKQSAYQIRNYGLPEYFNIASDMLKLAEQKRLPNDKREDAYKEENLGETIENIFPENFDEELTKELLKAHTEFVLNLLEENDQLRKDVYANLEGNEAVESILSRSRLISKEKVKALAEESPDRIKFSSDPFITFLVNTQNKVDGLSKKVKEINNTIDVLNQELAEAIFAVYGEEIPPDATSTLRISDGVIKGYEYNGTLAPPKTTYYGMYDRFHSFSKEDYPWGLPEKWKQAPSGMDLSTPINFASTNDIVGGNSGSSMINKNLEVIGLVFDGNLESLAGSMVYIPENNRAIAVDSKGLLQALKHVYKTKRLVYELLNGKIK